MKLQFLIALAMALFCLSVFSNDDGGIVIGYIEDDSFVPLIRSPKNLSSIESTENTKINIVGEPINAFDGEKVTVKLLKWNHFNDEQNGTDGYLGKLDKKIKSDRGTFYSICASSCEKLKSKSLDPSVTKNFYSFFQKINGVVILLPKIC